MHIVIKHLRKIFLLEYLLNAILLTLVVKKFAICAVINRASI